MPNQNVITILILVGTALTAHGTFSNISSRTYNSHGASNATKTLKLCPNGFTGDNCTTVCPLGSYGVDCAFNCSHYCVYQLCDRSNGSCSYGCQYGWEGVYCENDILTPEELQEQAIIMFFQFIAGIMAFYLIQIAIIKYRSLNIGCCCCCRYCPCNKKQKERKKRLTDKLRERRDAAFVVEMEPLHIQCNKKCSKKQIVHVV